MWNNNINRFVQGNLTKKFIEISNLVKYSHRELTINKCKKFKSKFSTWKHCYSKIPDKKNLNTYNIICNQVKHKKSKYILSNETLNYCNLNFCTHCHNIKLLKFKKNLEIVKLNSNYKNRYHVVLQIPTSDDASNDLSLLKMSMKDFSKSLKTYLKTNEVFMISKIEYSLNQNYNWNFHCHIILYSKDVLTNIQKDKLDVRWKQIVSKRVNCAQTFGIGFYIKDAFDETQKYLSDKNNIKYFKKVIKKFNSDIPFEIIDLMINEYILKKTCDIAIKLNVDMLLVETAYQNLINAFSDNKGIRTINFPRSKSISNLTNNIFEKDKIIYLDRDSYTEYSKTLNSTILPKIDQIIKENYLKYKYSFENTLNRTIKDIEKFVSKIRVKSTLDVNFLNRVNTINNIININSLNKNWMFEVKKLLNDNLNIIPKKPTDLIINIAKSDIISKLKDFNKLDTIVKTLDGQIVNKITFEDKLYKKIYPITSYLRKASELEIIYDDLIDLFKRVYKLLKKKTPIIYIKKFIMNHFGTDSERVFLSMKISKNRLYPVRNIIHFNKSDSLLVS